MKDFNTFVTNYLEDAYGLYTSNAFIEGKLYLPNAGITNEGTTNDSIRIWAGETPANKDKAPFRVTQDGSLYASKGTFSGTLNVKDNSIFRGTIMAAGIELLPDTDKDGKGLDYFYVTYNKILEAGEQPERPDYILDIDPYGLNIYDGGLNIYSDYYQTITNYCYGTDKRYPIISSLDNNSKESPRLLLTNLQIMQRKKIDNSVQTKNIHSINFDNGELIIRKFNIPQEQDSGYSLENLHNIANLGWGDSDNQTNTPILKLGQIEDGIYGLKLFDSFNIKLNNSNYIDIPVKTDTQVENNYITLYGGIVYNNAVQIKRIPNNKGLAFIYIGD